MSSEIPGAGSAKPSTDWDALARYMAGETSSAERAAIRDRLDANPADAELVARLDQMLGTLDLDAYSTTGIDVEFALAKVNGRRRRKLSPLYFRSGAQALAAASAILFFGLVTWRAFIYKTPPELPTIAARTFSTPVGGRDSLVLPDGSQVILGPRSELTIASDYNVTKRAVAIRGEGYFEVKHDAAHPFEVSASGTTIRDIGTSFVVHSDSAGDVRVVVSSGSVEMTQSGAQQATTRLNAGDVGMRSASGEISARRGAGRDEDLAWTRGKLIFHDAPLAEVRNDVRRWFGVELVMTDAALQCRTLSATFDRNDPVKQVLENIHLSLPATIERRGDTAFVRPTSESCRRR